MAALVGGGAIQALQEWSEGACEVLVRALRAACMVTRAEGQQAQGGSSVGREQAGGEGGKQAHRASGAVSAAGGKRPAAGHQQQVSQQPNVGQGGATGPQYARGLAAAVAVIRAAECKDQQ